jgi:hypothetical protein
VTRALRVVHSSREAVPAVPLEEWLPGALWVIQDVLKERQEQVRRYGLNADTPDGTGPETRWLLPYTSVSAREIEADLRADYEEFEEEAPVTWVHLLREELAEAFAESEPERLYEEVLQVAALAVSWLEKLNSRIINKENEDGH